MFPAYETVRSQLVFNITITGPMIFGCFCQSVFDNCSVLGIVIFFIIMCNKQKLLNVTIQIHSNYGLF